MKIKNIVEFIIKTVKGMIVGLGTITAGAGTFAIVLGIYDRCMEIIAKPLKNFKDNIKYIFPIILGICISVVIFKNSIAYLFNNYNAYVKCVFFGIIVGGVPTLLKVADKKGKNKKHFIALIAAFIATIVFTGIGESFGQNNGIESKMEPVYILIYGIIYGFGAIMPGMTTMHVLIFLGVWEPIFSGILSGNLSVIIPFGIGYIIVVLLTANLMSYFFKNFYGYTYYAIIGFSVTSLLMLIPDVNNITEKILCPIIAIVTSIIMYNISKLEDKIKEGEEKIMEEV